MKWQTERLRKERSRPQRAQLLYNWFHALFFRFAHFALVLHEYGRITKTSHGKKWKQPLCSSVSCCKSRLPHVELCVVLSVAKSPPPSSVLEQYIVSRYYVTLQQCCLVLLTAKGFPAFSYRVFLFSTIRFLFNREETTRSSPSETFCFACPWHLSRIKAQF